MCLCVISFRGHLVGQLSVPIALPRYCFTSRIAHKMAAALAGGDDFKRRVLYWFFAFVTILKYVIGVVINLVWCVIINRVCRAMPALRLRARVLLNQSIRFRFLITLLVLFTFSMFLLSAWWQVNSLITAFFPLPTFHNLQMLILLLIVPAVMLVVVGCLILKHSLLSHFWCLTFIPELGQLPMY